MGRNHYFDYAFLVFILISLLCLRCGEDSNQISEKEQKNRLALELPAYWEITSFDVDASQNIGTQVEPVLKSRFKATVSLKSDTYRYENTEADILFVASVAKKGDKKELYGISTAKPHAGSWNVRFELDDNPLTSLGKPIDSFKAESIIIKGTAEEDSFRLAQQTKRDKEERARIEAKEQWRKKLESIFSSNRKLRTQFFRDGTISDGMIVFDTFDKNSNRFSGQLHSNRITFLIEGQLTGTTMNFHQTFVIQDNKKIRESTFSYSVSLDEKADALIGTWIGNYGGGKHSGVFKVFFE